MIVLTNAHSHTVTKKDRGPNCSSQREALSRSRRSQAGKQNLQVRSAFSNVGV